MSVLVCMIIGIDPSYTGTGIAVLDGDKFVYSDKVSSNCPVYDNITTTHKGATVIVNAVLAVIDKYPNSDVIIEYPALQTVSGATLAILNGMLALALNKSQNVKSVCWVPPTACDSFSRNKAHSKTYLVNYCKDKGYISKRTSHDICTAMILCKLLVSIESKEYKNSYFYSIK